MLGVDGATEILRCAADYKFEMSLCIDRAATFSLLLKKVPELGKTQEEKDIFLYLPFGALPLLREIFAEWLLKFDGGPSWRLPAAPQISAEAMENVKGGEF